MAECISDDALIHLKTYKYSAVDKSPVSKYILGPWVGLLQSVRSLRPRPRSALLAALGVVQAAAATVTGAELVAQGNCARV